MGAKEYLPVTERGTSGFVTAAVVDPFGNKADRNHRLE